jgi:hypothetical protein
MRRVLATAAFVSCLLAAGCGGVKDATPAACLAGPNAYLQALEAAPGKVKLNDGTPISDCLAENQKGGDLTKVGAATVTAATNLNAEARDRPGGAANVQLGYLLGAAERGAEQTEGIHADLIRRLVAAARYSPDNRPQPAAFYRAYRSGYAAGRRNG